MLTLTVQMQEKLTAARTPDASSHCEENVSVKCRNYQKKENRGRGEPWTPGEVEGVTHQTDVFRNSC